MFKSIFCCKMRGCSIQVRNSCHIHLCTSLPKQLPYSLVYKLRMGKDAPRLKFGYQIPLRSACAPLCVCRDMCTHERTLCCHMPCVRSEHTVARPPYSSYSTAQGRLSNRSSLNTDHAPQQIQAKWLQLYLSTLPH